MMHFVVDIWTIILITSNACKLTNYLKVKFELCSFQGDKLQYNFYAFFENNY
jgi:hypothetical protein